MPIMIGVILQKIETIIILSCKSSKSVVGVENAYTGIVELCSESKIRIISICPYKGSFWEGIADAHIQVF